MFLKPAKNHKDYARSEIVEALYNASGHELPRHKLILKFYGRQDVSTVELDRAINLLLNHGVIQWTGRAFSLSADYMESDEYKERVRVYDKDYSR